MELIFNINRQLIKDTSNTTNFLRPQITSLNKKYLEYIAGFWVAKILGLSYFMNKFSGTMLYKTLLI